MKLKAVGLMTLVSVLGFTAGNANAGIIWDLYAGATVGGGAATVFADGHNDTNSAFSAGAMFGVDLPLLRFEAEYNYLSADDFSANIAMANAYFKMPSTVIMPYAGVGIGAAFGGDVDNGTPAYQGMIGVTFDMPVLPIKFDVEGRAVYIPDVVETVNNKPDVLHYDLRLKLRYVF